MLCHRTTWHQFFMMMGWTRRGALGVKAFFSLKIDFTWQVKGVRVPARAETPPIDLVGYIGRRHQLTIAWGFWTEFQRGLLSQWRMHCNVIAIRNALDKGSELAWGRLLSFSYWGLRCPGESGGGRQVSLSTLVRQQVAQFLENTDLPVEQVTPRTRYGVHGGDETLKRRVE